MANERADRILLSKHQQHVYQMSKSFTGIRWDRKKRRKMCWTTALNFSAVPEAPFSAWAALAVHDSMSLRKYVKTLYKLALKTATTTRVSKQSGSTNSLTLSFYCHRRSSPSIDDDYKPKTTPKPLLDSTKCQANELSCANGVCLDKLRFCDNVPDCDDGSDEGFCGEPKDLKYSLRVQFDVQSCKILWYFCRPWRRPK